MSAIEASRHALYTRLEEVLGQDHAETLMTHLPQHDKDEVATKGDVARLRSEVKDRFDRMEDRFDRMEDRLDRHQRFYVATTFGALTAMTAIFSFVVTIVT